MYGRDQLLVTMSVILTTLGVVAVLMFVWLTPYINALTGTINSTTTPPLSYTFKACLEFRGKRII